MLNLLPDSFREIKNAIKYGRESLTFEVVVNALKSRDLELKVETKERGEGLSVRGRTSNRSLNQKQNGNKRSKSRFRSKSRVRRTCYYCHKEGHYIKDCFKKQKDDKERKPIDGDLAIVSNESENGEVLAVCLDNDNSDWILDSGCTYHMCPNKSWFHTYSKTNGGQVLLGNNVSCSVVGIGSVHIKLCDGTVKTLSSVRHVPELQRNLISLGMLDEAGYTCKTENGSMKITHGSFVAMKGIKRNGLYVLLGKTIIDSAASVNSSKHVIDQTNLWHKRLGHISEKGLYYLNKSNVFGNDVVSKLEFCENCVLGKQHRLSFNLSSHKSKAILDYVHSDLWGPAKVQTQSGNRYFISFIDDYSRKVWVYLLKNKSDALGKFKEWKLLTEKQTGNQVKVLRTDNGLEYCNADFDEFCKAHGILRHITVKYTPQQNGIAERMNRTLLDKVRCMLVSSGLPKLFWGEAVMTAAHLVNMSPSTAINFKTPEELWTGKIPDYSTFRVFGCAGYVHQSEGKLEPRAVKGVFLGYPQGVKGYRLWLKEDKGYRVTTSRDVTFDELTMPCRAISVADSGT